MEKEALYVGNSKNVLRRIRDNHCRGNVNSSVLRQTVAKLMGMTIKKMKNENKTNRFIIDSPVNEEPKLSDYIQQGEWQFIPCESEEEARDFERFVIEKVKPRYNESYKEEKTEIYERKLKGLLNSPLLNVQQIPRTAKVPGVYIFYNQQLK